MADAAAAACQACHAPCLRADPRSCTKIHTRVKTAKRLLPGPQARPRVVHTPLPATLALQRHMSLRSRPMCVQARTLGLAPVSRRVRIVFKTRPPLPVITTALARTPVTVALSRSVAAPALSTTAAAAPPTAGIVAHIVAHTT